MTETALSSDEIMRRAANRGGEALDALLPALADGRVEPAELVHRPRLLADLDIRSRRAYGHSPVLVPESFFLDRPSPLTAALATMSRDGRVRERAVVALARPGAAAVFLSFIVLRCGDWVSQVREPARVAVAELLASDLARHLPLALPMAAYTAARHRGGWVMTRLRQALAERFDELGRVLVRSRDQRERRLAFEVGADLGRWTHDELVHFAVHAKDPLIRLRGVDAVSATADVAALRLLVRSRYSGVRLSALVGLARLSLDDEVAALVDDPAPLVRAYARSRATDPVAHYRAAVAAGPTPATVAGLGEVGHYADEARLTPLLSHHDPRIRAAAVRALAAVDSLPVPAVTALLRDLSPTVVREAANALRGRHLSGDLWLLLAEPRVEVRRGAYRVLTGGDLRTRLRAALLLAADADPGLARRGHADAGRLVRHGLAGLGHYQHDLSAGDRAELAGLAARLSPYLADGVRALR
ncbi:HEAT repeat domain-containing protein [Actinoplanes sp. NPDC000266]